MFNCSWIHKPDIHLLSESPFYEHNAHIFEASLLLQTFVRKLSDFTSYFQTEKLLNYVTDNRKPKKISLAVSVVTVKLLIALGVQVYGL